MGRSLIAGLSSSGWPQNLIRVSDPMLEQLDAIASRHQDIQTFADNHTAVQGADVVLFAVKPQVIKNVAQDLANTIAQVHPLVMSIAAGVPSGALSAWLGAGTAIVRCMPNTPALLRCGITGLYANNNVNIDQRAIAETILQTVGVTLWFNDETQLDVVTAVSGSGPAYYFYLMEALEQAATELQLSSKQARMLTLHTALGAARLALETEEDPAGLRSKVTSKGGTTERAISELHLSIQLIFH